MWTKTEELVGDIPYRKFIETYCNGRLKVVIETNSNDSENVYYTHYVKVEMANGNTSLDLLAKYIFKNKEHINEILEFYNINENNILKEGL